MQIEINHTDEHNDYFTLTDDQGNEYPWHGRKGVQQDPEKVLLLIRQREYPGADVDGTLEGIETWISEGHTNPEISEDYQEQVSPAIFALTPDDPVKPDLRVGERRVDDDIEVVGEDFRKAKEDRRKLKPEILEPAKFETRTRIIRPEQVIEKKPWVSSHPKKLAAIEALKKAKTWEEGLPILLELL